MRRHFGDMLLERRRQLGISIQQVSNIVKIRPQIIEYFETENFAAMPPRGYAQGMISSYARYLGLNPREVVDAYFDALHEYENGNGGRVGRFQDAAADASPRSSNAPARYMMVNSVPSSRFAQRPPQAGYVSESTSPHEPMASARLRPASNERRGARPGYDPSLRSRTNGRPAPYGRRPEEGASGPGRAPGVNPRRDPRASGPRRRPDGGFDRGYRDYDGRRPDSRTAPGRQRGRGGSQRTPQPALDPRLLVMGGIALLVVFVLGGFLLLRGCAPKPTAPAGSAEPSISKVDKPSEDSASDESASNVDEGSTADDEDSGGSTAEGAAQPAKEEPKETLVRVKLKEKGSVAWVEVKLDGKIVLGKQVVGPFEEEFKVESQIDITTDSPSVVSVYKNGEKVRYDTKVSGVGKISIVAPKTEESDEKVVDGDGDGTPDMTAEEARAAGLPVPETTEQSEDQPAA